MLRYAPPIKFFKRKKRKKESQSFKWKVSKKQVFLKKYYPIHHRKCGREVGIECWCEPLWVEIFSKTRRAWTCFFVNLELTFALFFFIFYFDFIYQSSSYNRILFEGLGVDLEEGRLRKVYQILGMDKKSKSKNINAFYPALKFDTLSWIWFLRMPKCLMKWEVSI